MGAIAAELQFSSCNPVLSSTRHCSSKSRKNHYGYYHGIGPSNSRIGGSSNPGFRGGGAVAFGLKSWVGIDPLVSSWTGRWVPQTKCGEGSVRQIRSLKSFDGERRLGGGLRWKGRRRAMAVQLLWGKVEAPKPDFVALVQITGEEHFDQILNEAVERNQPIVVDWLAAWCRKCIYLKPKIEKLAAEYHPDIKFYYIDVNTVPQALVKRANVTKMPTIQLWKDGQHVAEVIGGHQAWLVMDEVRQMINLQK